MAEKPLKPISNPEPAAPPDSTKLLARLDSVERTQKILSDTIKFVKDTNSVVLVVLFLGFVALLASYIAGVMQSSAANTAAQIEFIKSIEKFNSSVDKLNRYTETLPSSTSSVLN